MPRARAEALAGVCFACTLAFACGGKTPPPATGGAAAPPDAAIAAADAVPLPLDRDLPRLAARSVQLYDGVVAAFRAANGDCGVATIKLGELSASFGDVVAANQQVLHDGRARELKLALVTYDDMLSAAAKEIVGSPTLARCAQDAAFTRAFDDLVGAPP